MLTAIPSERPDSTHAVQGCKRFHDSLDAEGLQALNRHMDMLSQAQVVCSWRIKLMPTF